MRTSTSPQGCLSRSPSLKVYWSKKGEFQYAMLITGQRLQGTLPMPPEEMKDPHGAFPKPKPMNSLWGTTLRRRILKPSITGARLWMLCRYKEAGNTPFGTLPPKAMTGDCFKRQVLGLGPSKQQEVMLTLPITAM